MLQYTFQMKQFLNKLAFKGENLRLFVFFGFGQTRFACWLVLP